MIASIIAGYVSWYLTKPPGPTQPGHPSVCRQQPQLVLVMITAAAMVRSA